MANLHYKLVYFNYRALGDVSRKLFALGDQEYEDFQFKLSEWPAIKASMPFKQAPLLEITDTTSGKVTRIAQSNAIERYLANKFGLFGKDDLERARIDMINEQANDLYRVLHSAHRYLFLDSESDEAKQALEKALNETVPLGLDAIQKLYEENQTETSNSGFLVGNELTYADVKLVALYDWVRSKRDEILAKFPALSEHFHRVRNFPKLKEHYIKSDKLEVTVYFEKKH